MPSKLAELAAKRRNSVGNVSSSQSAIASPVSTPNPGFQASKLASLAATPRSSEPKRAALSNLSARLKKQAEVPAQGRSSSLVGAESSVGATPVPSVPTNSEKLALLARKRQRPQVADCPIPTLAVGDRSGIESYFIAITEAPPALGLVGSHSTSYKIHKSTNRLSSAKLLKLRFRQAIYLPYTHPSALDQIEFNFSKPSPDDIILAAQAKAFEENNAATSSEKRNQVPTTLETSKNNTRPNGKGEVLSGGAGGTVAGVQNRLASLNIDPKPEMKKSPSDQLRARKGRSMA
ncbi:hypothetical protein NADFUDRAFT_72079 [Nadsonia fulvescens var. elongata DSM 6958]|uniref:Uncharacterized protein n=1 Tax=Nadsonia fulvescens var. elongata DSM 6958 TaxID=857566 RepID=A0A1E3PD14_9ASCO|nr:hypothetical protein NADFUDRAFT_72079 [Nadsonia fulvescens var. elongata DSM 6958]